MLDLVSTKHPRKVSYATEKGEKMNKSLGDFLDFIEQASIKGSRLGMDLMDELSKPDITATNLLQFFHDEGYDGVSLKDCGKLASIAKRGGLREILDTEKY